MKAVNRIKDLEPFGIDPLTGEACGLMYRVLCDVTEKGKKIIEKCLGLANLGPAENWNRGSDSDPHIGSIMLPLEMVTPIAVFALLENGCKQVLILKSGAVCGFEDKDPAELVAFYLDHYKDDIQRNLGYRGTAGDRNVHVMSGRVT